MASPQLPSSQDRHPLEWLAAAFLVALCAAIYLPHLGAELVFDDARLTDGSIFGVYGGVESIRQRFLSYGSFVWLQNLLGEGWWKQRIVNLGLHAVACAGVYALTRELLSAQAQVVQRATLMLCVGVFALHPVAVYATGYLVQRSILMATLFTAWGLFAAARGLRTGAVAWALVALVLYALAVLSKEHAITAVLCLVPLYVYLRKPSLRGVGIGLLVLALAAGAAFSFLYPIYRDFLGTAFDERSQAYLRQLEALQPGITAKAHGLSVANQAWLFFRYGLFWWFPNVLDMSLDLRPAFPLSMLAPASLAGLAGYALTLAACIWAVVRREGTLQLAALLVLMPLLIFSTEFVLVWIQDPFVLYRSYLWAIVMPGLVYLLVTSLMQPRAQLVLLGIVCLVLTALAFERANSLRTSFSAWDDAARKVDMGAPANAVGRWRAFLNRGSELLERGSAQSAIADFDTAVKLGEPDGSAAMNIGIALQSSKQHPQAMTWFERAQTMGYKEPALAFHMAESQSALGQAAAALDNYGRALQQQAAPEVLDRIREKRAGAAMAARRFELALEDYRALGARQPQALRYQVGVNFALINLGRAREAVDALAPVIAAHPDGHQALYTRALAYEALNDRGNAVKDIDAALALQPANPLYVSVRARLTGTAASGARARN
ncbi:MAG: tetratricopeptide repeat protein [Betaproteobacteria bacterium]|nr:tetratricopeptide repeat protein [Betaproteobacteria bacterium]